MSDEPLEFSELARRARAGQLSRKDLFTRFLDLSVMVPSSTDPRSAGVTPVMVTIDGQEYMAVATDKAALARLGQYGKFAVMLTGSQIIDGAGHGIGVMVESAGPAVGFDAELIASFRGRA